MGIESGERRHSPIFHESTPRLFISGGSLRKGSGVSELFFGSRIRLPAPIRSGCGQRRVGRRPRRRHISISKTGAQVIEEDGVGLLSLFRLAGQIVTDLGQSEKLFRLWIVDGRRPQAPKGFDWTIVIDC